MSPLSKKLVRFKAELVIGNYTCCGFIENISEYEVYLVTPVFSFDSLTLEMLLEIKFSPVPGETLNFPCKLKWTYKTPPHGLTSSMGVQIIEHIPGYKKFFQTLQ